MVKNLKLYVDGVEVDSQPHNSGIHNSTANVQVGAVNAGTLNWDGSISQPMIFDRALTNEEVTILYNQNLPKDYAALPTSITDDCVLALEMTSNDNTLTDLSVNTNNGTANGGVTSDGVEIDWDDTTGFQSSSSSMSSSSSSM